MGQAASEYDIIPGREEKFREFLDTAAGQYKVVATDTRRISSNSGYLNQIKLARDYANTCGVAIFPKVPPVTFLIHWVLMRMTFVGFASIKSDLAAFSEFCEQWNR